MANNVCIVGSNSFLAQYVAQGFKEYDSLITGLAKSNKSDHIDLFTPFSCPDQPISLNYLLDFNVIIYAAGAGIQSNIKDPVSSIYYLNAYLPIDIALFLESNQWEGKFITFGSYFEIGFNKNNHFFTEEQVVNASNQVPNDYCASKRLLSRFYSSKLMNINYHHLILPNIYGVGENDNRLIPYLVNSISNNLPVKLTSGEQIRQYIHAKDVATIVCYIALNKVEKGILNITQKTPIQVKNLALLIYRLLGIEPKNDIFGQSQRSDASMDSLLLSSEKFEMQINIQHEISLENGILSYL